jgi:hypothetical protein
MRVFADPLRRFDLVLDTGGVSEFPKTATDSGISVHTFAAFLYQGTGTSSATTVPQLYPEQIARPFAQIVTSLLKYLGGILHGLSLNLYSSFLRRGLSNLAVILILLSGLITGCASYGPPKPVAEASLAVSANNLNFNTVAVGQTVKQTLHVSNTGTAPLQITGLAVSDQQFVVSGPSVPRVILPNLGVDYTLTFTPAAAGSPTAALTIQSNARNSITSVSLAGIGRRVVAAVEVSPSSLNFGNLNLESTVSKNVTLQNTGNVNVTVSGITVSGSGFGYSELSPGFSLPPAQSVTFQVWFHPKLKGASSGTLSILSANLSSPASLALAGDGISSTSPNPPPPTNPPTRPPPTTPPPTTPPPTTPPPTTPPPTTPTVQHTVRLSWSPSNSTIAGYNVYRSQSNKNSFSRITSALLSSTDYDDTTAESGNTYYYAVTAVTSSGAESAFSNEATAVIPTP